MCNNWTHTLVVHINYLFIYINISLCYVVRGSQPLKVKFGRCSDLARSGGIRGFELDEKCPHYDPIYYIMND